jgi:aspartyl-tRNA(Asn)/glutamyl-tRNA(Gln) amidotransferase subunit B
VPGLADYAERAVAALKTGSPKDVANWVRQDVLALVNDQGLDLAAFPPEVLAELVDLTESGTISRGQAKDLLAEARVASGSGKAFNPTVIVEERGLAQVSDVDELTAAVDAVLAANAAAVEEYRAAADDKARKKKRGFLMGEVMRGLEGKGNAQMLSQLLDARLS